jgi:hypothetical protein
LPVLSDYFTDARSTAAVLLSARSDVAHCASETLPNRYLRGILGERDTDQLMP